MTLLLLWSFNSNAQYLTEGFEGATFPPAGWEDVVGPGSDNGDLWASSIARVNTGTQSANFDDFDNAQDHDRWLISPAIDLSGATAPELSYFDNVQFPDFAGDQEVFYSTDYDGLGDPTTATWILLNDAVNLNDNQWIQYGPYALPVASSVYIAYNYIGTYAASWFIDDVLVREALTCTPVTIASAVIIEDCPNFEFSLEIEITDLGDSGTVTVTNTGGEPDVDVSSVPTTVTLGPFPTGTPVDVSVLHEINSDCDVFVGTGVDACPPPVPTNDDFASATPITCATTALAGNTDSATLDEDNAPDGFGAVLDAPNVWFSYDSAVEGAGDITINLCNSDYDTSVLVYTGTTGNLTLEIANDDSTVCGPFYPELGRSEVTFTANGTDTYFITVEGYEFGDTGNFEMTVSCAVSCMPAQLNQDCASATALPVDGTTSTQDNTCATPNPTSPSCDIFLTIADLWFTFDAPTSGQVNIVTALGTATASHLAVYEGASCAALTEISCSAVAAAGASLTGLTGGTTYYIQLWNDGSEEGTIDITLSDASLSTNSFENENAFSYFPNPVKNELTLKAQNNIQNVSVFNMLGQEVLRATPNTLESNLDMNELSQGAYFVQVTINNVTETVRILKQ